MIQDRRIALIKQLFSSTKSGEITWISSNNDGFSSSFGAVAVQISRVVNPGGGDDFQITVQSGGRTVDAFVDTDLSFVPSDWRETGLTGPFDAMKQTFDMARFAAEGGVGAYDEIFASLMKGAA